MNEQVHGVFAVVALEGGDQGRNAVRGKRAVISGGSVRPKRSIVGGGVVRQKRCIVGGGPVRP
jgi:hypothetical protein